ncbi:TPA: hypothetical protein ACH3X3_003610 [Trebouxia sp. C0006]
MSPDESDLTAVAQPLLADEDTVDQEQALNKPTEQQSVSFGKQHSKDVLPQVLVPLNSTDLPNASQLDLSQLKQAQAVWHQHRCTQWLWVIASIAAVYVSFFTVYHIGLGIFPGILGIITAVWGLWWLRLQPVQQASNMKYCFKMQRALAYITAAYSVMLGLTMIIFELVCFKGDIRCELLDMSRTGRSMQIGIGVGFIIHAAISFAAARNANDVEVAFYKSTLAVNI